MSFSKAKKDAEVVAKNAPDEKTKSEAEAVIDKAEGKPFICQFENCKAIFETQADLDTHIKQFWHHNQAETEQPSTDQSKVKP